MGGTDQLVAWVKPVRLPVHPLEWLTPELCAALPEVLCVRALRYRVAHTGFRTQTVTLVTTLLDVDRSPADGLAALDGMRWQVETNLRHCKETMGLEVLHCQRLSGILKELTSLCFGGQRGPCRHAGRGTVARRRPGADQLH